jgi:molybdopterin-synthase adenylyltransferase
MDIRSQNLGIMTLSELDIINKQKVMIIGLGGLGGHIANSLVRLGVQQLILVDFDCFQPSNLNRQLFSSLENLGQYKVISIKSELYKIRKDMTINTYVERVQSLSAQVFLNVDIIFDAVDCIETKKYIEQVASKNQIPLIHGAIAGYYGQIGISTPNSKLLSTLYEEGNIGLEKELKCPTFIPPIVANMMVVEFVKYHINFKDALVNQILMIDTLNHEYQIVLKV